LRKETAKEADMSDPRYRDSRLDPPPIREDEIRSQRMNELESSNAMWGWVAGAVVLALVLVFVFTRGQVDNSPQASLPPPAATTGSAPSPNAQPSTTGQATSGQATPAPTTSPAPKSGEK
jgi:cell division septation protein DedD